MPKDYFTTVYHQKAVRVLGTRDLYLRTVYCHVVNYTQSQGKWSGTFQEMENQIEISKSKICRSMNQLIEMGLVRKEDKHTFIANSNPSVADSNQNDADSNKSVANSNSPCTPINKEETQVSDARMQAHDVPDSEVSFADFCAAFRRTCGPITMKQKDDAYEAWRKLNPRFKKALMAEFDKPNGERTGKLLTSQRSNPNGYPVRSKINCFEKARLSVSVWISSLRSNDANRLSTRRLGASNFPVSAWSSSTPAPVASSNATIPPPMK